MRKTKTKEKLIQTNPDNVKKSDKQTKIDAVLDEFTRYFSPLPETPARTTATTKPPPTEQQVRNEVTQSQKKRYRPPSSIRRHRELLRKLLNDAS